MHIHFEIYGHAHTHTNTHTHTHTHTHTCIYTSKFTDTHTHTHTNTRTYFHGTKEINENRSLSQIRQATLRKNTQKVSEDSKKNAKLAAIIKRYQKSKKKQKKQKLSQEPTTELRSKELIQQRKFAYSRALALTNNTDEIMRMLFNLEKTQRERDDLKNQLAHQNLQPKPKRPSLGNSEWCTRHMSIEKDHHDVILEYIKELTKGKFNRNPEWDEGFETERWYNLDDRETKVCNYYVFEYIITVCVYVCVCARVRVFQYVTTLHSMFSLYSHFGMRWS